MAALSGWVDESSLEAGVEGLRSLGFEPVLAANLRSRDGLFAGSDDERLQAFHDLVAEPDLRAVLFARGGHGVLRLLDRVDWQRLAERPLAYCGYSDLTPFLSGVQSRLGLVAFHGPMVAVEFADGLEDEEREEFLACLGGDFPRRRRVAPAAETGPGAGGGAEEVVEGRLAGGCLSLLASSLGTASSVDLRGAVLFLEDVDEPAYRIDRMLTQLRLAGSLDGVRAIVGGAFDSSDRSEGDDDVPALPELLRALGAAVEVPVTWGCASGHTRPNLTLPLGSSCRFHIPSGELLLG